MAVSQLPPGTMGMNGMPGMDGGNNVVLLLLLLLVYRLCEGGMQGTREGGRE